MKRPPEVRDVARHVEFPPAFCGGLIEAMPQGSGTFVVLRFPPAFCGGLIEAMERPVRP